MGDEHTRYMRESCSQFQFERDEARRELARVSEELDETGAELSRMETDQLEIHDALEDAGLSGAINAQNILERIDLLRQRAERAEAALLERGEE